MSDLIRRQDAIDTVEELNRKVNDGRENDTICTSDVLRRINALPSADRPSIVRCGECKHRYYADNRVPHERTWVCERFMNEEITSNDFCSWGERKGGDTE